MARRRLTITRLDPWSVLKFGMVANIVLFAVSLLFAGIVWYIIDRLQLVDQACSIAIDVGFASCGINAGNLFRALALLGGMGVIVGTAVWVFAAFLYNLIADLTGGLTIGVTAEEPSVGGGHAQNTPGRARWEPAASGRASAGGPGTAGGPHEIQTRGHDAGAGAPRNNGPAQPAPDSPQPAGTRAGARGRRRRSDGEQLFGDG